MMKRKGIRVEILDILTELENHPDISENLKFFFCGKLQAFCEVLDGDLFMRDLNGNTFLDENYRERLERFIDL